MDEPPSTAAGSPFRRLPPELLAPPASTPGGSSQALLPPAAAPDTPALSPVPLLPASASAPPRLPQIGSGPVKLPPMPKSPPLLRTASSSGFSVPGISLRYISEAMKNIKERRGVGLVRRLSIDADVTRRLEEYFEAHHAYGGPAWLDVYTSVFGVKGGADGDEIGYDYFGSFPMFVDQQGREYFLAKTTAEEAAQYGASSNVVMNVRIPRGLTRAEQASTHTQRELPITQFSEAGDLVLLHARIPPQLPVVFDPEKRDVTSPRSARQELYDQLPRAEPVEARVVDLSPGYRSSYRAALRVPPERLELLHKLAHLKSIYSTEVVNFMLDIMQHLPPAQCLDVSEYLQHVWVPRLKSQQQFNVQHSSQKKASK